MNKPDVLARVVLPFHRCAIVIEKWRVEYNTKRPHSALGYRPPAPVACSPEVPKQYSQPLAVI